MKKTVKEINEQELRSRLSLAVGDRAALEGFQVVYAFQKFMFRTYHSYALAFSREAGEIWALNLNTEEVSRLDICRIRRIKERLACEYLLIPQGLHRTIRYCVPLLASSPHIYRCTQIEAAQVFRSFCEGIGNWRSQRAGKVQEPDPEDEMGIERLPLWQESQL